jgi:uncharacterized protein
MSRATERVLIPGDAGAIETQLDFPEGNPHRGVALVAHPHPLHGGALDNKVTQTLAWAFRDLGYVSLRPNFRGVGQSAGVHDKGIGETDDLQRVAHWAAQRFGNPQTVLAGFSFGSYVQIRLAQRIAVERMVLVGTAVGRISGDREYALANVPPDTLVIHGELDETVPLANVLAWAAPQELPVVVIPGADHFFHRRLHIIRGIVKRAWPSLP